jgi:phosphoserine aminotransferase
MLCVEDALDSLRWIEEIGGVAASIARSQENLAAIARWVEKSDWADFLAAEPSTRSSTSICLVIRDPWFEALALDQRRASAGALARRLADEGVAYDIEAYREAPPGLRIWGGATVEVADVEALLPWLDWGFAELRAG